MDWIILIIIFIATILDAFRDRWIPKVCRGEDWLLWHLAKWGAFFPPLILLSYFWLKYYNFQMSYIFIFLLFAILCKIIWKIIYKYKKEIVKKEEKELV
jgi:sensor histidine kinase YesM